ncbi:hypothetical protein SNK05_012231 [Fusarium graminearum]
MLKLRLFQVKRNCPIVDIAVANILLRTRVIALSAKNTPVNIVEILANIAFTDLEIDTVGEILDKIPVGPIDSVLFRLQRLGRVRFETVTIFTRSLVRSTNSPKFFAGRLFSPANVLFLSLARADLDLILGILSKYVVGINSETISPRFDTRNSRSATLVKVSPILVGFGIKHVILEIDAALCENSNGVLSSLGKINLDLKLSTAFGRNIVWDVLGNGIIEIGVPFWIGVLSSVSLGFEDIGRARESIKVEVLLWAISDNILAGTSNKLTGPKVRSNPLVILGYED